MSLAMVMIRLVYKLDDIDIPVHNDKAVKDI